MLINHLQETKRENTKIKKKTRVLQYIYQNELDKACFGHDMAHGNFQYLPRRPAYDKILDDKAFNIAKNLKYNGYENCLALMVYNFFDKKISVTRVNKFAGGTIKNKMLNSCLMNN